MARTKASGTQAAIKGGARNAKKRIGTRGATFKDAKRPKSSGMRRMETRYVEPVEIAPVASMDTGATTLGETVAISGRETINKASVTEQVTRVYWINGATKIPETKSGTHQARMDRIGGGWRRVEVIEEKTKAGYWSGATVATRVDKRKLNERLAPTRSDKASIGKTIPTTDKTPVIEAPPVGLR